jgi:hypothetical protein
LWKMPCIEGSVIALAGARASSQVMPARNAVDEDPGTVWASEAGGPQWISVDFGKKQQIWHVQVSWGLAVPDYTIEVSDDATLWSIIDVASGLVIGADRTDRRDVFAEGRYVRLSFTAGPLGSSINELRVYGDSYLGCGNHLQRGWDPYVLASIKPNAGYTLAKGSNEIVFDYTGPAFDVLDAPPRIEFRQLGWLAEIGTRWRLTLDVSGALDQVDRPPRFGATLNNLTPSNILPGTDSPSASTPIGALRTGSKLIFDFDFPMNAGDPFLLVLTSYPMFNGTVEAAPTSLDKFRITASLQNISPPCQASGTSSTCSCVQAGGVCSLQHFNCCSELSCVVDVGTNTPHCI